MSGENNLRKDPAWRYARLTNPNNKNSFTCNFCGVVTNGGVCRAKQHIIGHKNAKACTKAPDQVKEEIRNYIKDVAQKKKNDREAVNLAPDFDDDGFDDDDDDDEDVCVRHPSANKRSIGSTNASNNLASGSSGACSSTGRKKPRTKGPIDVYFTPNPENVVNARNLTKLNEADKAQKEMRDRACSALCRWMYDAGISFNAVKYDSFATAIEAVGQYGPGMKPPSYHEVRVPFLKKEFEHTQRLMKDHRDEWEKYGCSIMCDGWKDKRERTLINFLVNCPKGSMFLESVDASSESKTGQMLFELICTYVEKVGPSNVVQVVTDSAANNVLAGKMLEDKYPNIYWTPCAAHCLDLMLEDIFKLKTLKKTFERAITVHGYIYSRPGVVNLMRKCTEGKELLRPAKTRFATAFITLSRMHKERFNLRKMFTSAEWITSKWAKEAQGKKVSSIVMMTSFWKTVYDALRFASPLVKVLRMVDGERKPPMGYIYGAMERAKEAIATSFKNNEKEYAEIFKIIDERWSVQLHRPLHAAGYYLNPELLHKDMEKIEKNKDVMKELLECIEKIVPSADEQDQITGELPLYIKGEGLFGTSMAKRQRDKKSPGI